MFRRSIHTRAPRSWWTAALLYRLKDLVIAVDARTGTERWRYQPDLGGDGALLRGDQSRVAVLRQPGVLATLDARLIALDRATPESPWDVRAAAPAEG